MRNQLLDVALHDRCDRRGRQGGFVKLENRNQQRELDVGFLGARRLHFPKNLQRLSFSQLVVVEVFVGGRRHARKGGAPASGRQAVSERVGSQSYKTSALGSVRSTSKHLHRGEHE